MRDFVRVEAAQPGDAEEEAAGDAQTQAQAHCQDQLPPVRLEISILILFIISGIKLSCTTSFGSLIDALSRRGLMIL